MSNNVRIDVIVGFSRTLSFMRDLMSAEILISGRGEVLPEPIDEYETVWGEGGG